MVQSDSIYTWLRDECDERKTEKQKRKNYLLFYFCTGCSHCFFYWIVDLDSELNAASCHTSFSVLMLTENFFKLSHHCFKSNPARKHILLMQNK